MRNATCTLSPITRELYSCAKVSSARCAKRAKVRANGLWSACLVSGDECIMSDEAVECAQPSAPPPPPEQPLLLNVCSLIPITTFRRGCADLHMESCVGSAKVRDGVVGLWSACLRKMHDERREGQLCAAAACAAAACAAASAASTSAACAAATGADGGGNVDHRCFLRRPGDVRALALRHHVPAAAARRRGARHERVDPPRHVGRAERSRSPRRWRRARGAADLPLALDTSARPSRYAPRRCAARRVGANLPQGEQGADRGPARHREASVCRAALGAGAEAVGDVRARGRTASGVAAGDAEHHALHRGAARLFQQHAPARPLR